jgi:hypothetical protein
LDFGVVLAFGFAMAFLHLGAMLRASGPLNSNRDRPFIALFLAA